METLGKFLSFIGDILGFFWESFFVRPETLFSAVASAPGSSFFEILFIIVLISLAATIFGGVIMSVRRLSVVPFIKAVEFYVRLFGKIGAAIIIVLISSMVYEVIARYFFSAPTKWAFEMAYMLMGTSFLFGIGYCLQMGRHIRVDFLYDHVSPKKRAVIDLVGFTLLLPMVLWLCAGLWDYFLEAYRMNEESGESAWNPIIWPFRFAFVIGFLMFFLQCIVEMLKSVLTLMGRDVPQPPPVEGLG